MQIFLQGRLKSKPEIKESRNGKTWVKALIEEDSRDDSRQNEPNILPIVCFGHAANRVKDLQPGDSVTVVCRLSGTRFEAPSGEIRYGVQLIGEQILVPAGSRKEASHI